MTTHISWSGVGRHACPFYGFAMVGKTPILMDQKGNQCPLIRNSYSPCQMEVNDRTPNWNDCPLNSEENSVLVERIEREYKIFPRELWSRKDKRWKGISFSEWKKKVMG